MNFSLFSMIFSVMTCYLITCEQPPVRPIKPDHHAENIANANQQTQRKLHETTTYLSSPHSDHVPSHDTSTHSPVIRHGRNVAEDTAGTIPQLHGIPPDASMKQELSSHAENSVGLKEAEFAQHIAKPHAKRGAAFSNDNAHPEVPLDMELQGARPYASVDSEDTFSVNQHSEEVPRFPTFSHRGAPLDPVPSHPPFQRDIRESQNEPLLPLFPNDNFQGYHERNPTDDFVSFTIVLPAATKQCLFYSPISNFVIEYQVIRGGNLDVGLLVRDPDGEHIVVRDFSPDANLPIAVPRHFAFRPYSVCFDNRKASYADKHVALSIDLDVNWENPSPQELIAIERLKRNFAETQLEQTDQNYLNAWKSIIIQLEALFSRMRRISHLQQKSDNFASIDQSLMEANLYRVTSGSILQIMTMLTVAGVQILLLRALFDPTNRFYRLWFGNRSVISTRC